MPDQASQKEDPVRSDKDYMRGYTAGTRKAERTIKELQGRLDQCRKSESDSYSRIMAAALEGVLRSPKDWKLEGEPVESISHFVDLADRIARDSYIKLREKLNVV